MPLFHGNALMACLFPALVGGSSVVLRRRFSASAFLPDVRRHGCTFFNYVGRALSYVLAQPETPEDADNQLRWCLGSEASPRDRREFKRRFGCPVVEGYSSSEGAVVIQPFGGMPRGALGRAQEGADVVGFAYSGPFRSRPAYAGTRESSIYLAPAARGRGLGRALYAELLERLDAAGVHTVLAVVALPNDASEALHRSCGFTPVGVLEQVGYKFGAWVDTALWQLRLGDDEPAPG